MGSLGYWQEVPFVFFVKITRAHSESSAYIPRRREKTLLFQNLISSEPDVVETSNNYVWAAFLQLQKPVWGAKALRISLQPQKKRGSRPNFQILRKRLFFRV